MRQSHRRSGQDVRRRATDLREGALWAQLERRSYRAALAVNLHLPSVNSCGVRKRELARARAPRRSRLVQCCERILHPLNRVPEK